MTPDKKREQSRQYYKKNAESIKQRESERYTQVSQKKNEYSKKYYIEHSKKILPLKYLNMIRLYLERLEGMGTFQVFQNSEFHNWIVRGIEIARKKYVVVYDLARSLQNQKIPTYYLKQVSDEHKTSILVTPSRGKESELCLVDQIGFMTLFKGSNLTMKEDEIFKNWLLKEVFPNISPERNTQNTQTSLEIPNDDQNKMVKEKMMNENEKSPQEIVDQAIIEGTPAEKIAKLNQEIADLKLQLQKRDLYARLNALESQIEQLIAQDSAETDEMLKIQGLNETKLSNLTQDIANHSTDISSLRGSLTELERDYKKALNELEKYQQKAQSNPFAPYFDTISDSKHKIEDLGNRIEDIENRIESIKKKCVLYDGYIEKIAIKFKNQRERIEKIESFIAGFSALFQKKE